MDNRFQKTDDCHLWEIIFKIPPNSLKDPGFCVTLNTLFKGCVERVYEAVKIICQDYYAAMSKISALTIEIKRIDEKNIPHGKKIIDLTFPYSQITETCSCEKREHSLLGLACGISFCGYCGRDIKPLFGFVSDSFPEKREKIFICSRIGSQTKEDFEENIRRTKLYSRWAVLNGFDPENTGLYYCEFLNDFSAEERLLGQKLGRKRMADCSSIIVIIDQNDPRASTGMIEDIKEASNLGLKFLFKTHQEITNWLSFFDRADKK